MRISLLVLLLATRAWAVDTIAPTTPRFVRAESWDKSKLRVTWGTSRDNVGVTFYELQVDQSPIFTAPTTQLIPNGSATGWTVAGLSPNITYYVRVRAGDLAGNRSAYSTINSATTRNVLPAGFDQVKMGSSHLSQASGDPTDPEGFCADQVSGQPSPSAGNLCHTNGDCFFPNGLCDKDANDFDNSFGDHTGTLSVQNTTPSNQDADHVWYLQSINSLAACTDSTNGNFLRFQVSTPTAGWYTLSSAMLVGSGFPIRICYDSDGDGTIDASMGTFDVGAAQDGEPSCGASACTRNFHFDFKAVSGETLTTIRIDPITAAGTRQMFWVATRPKYHNRSGVFTTACETSGSTSCTSDADCSSQKCLKPAFTAAPTDATLPALVMSDSGLTCTEGSTIGAACSVNLDCGIGGRCGLPEDLPSQRTKKGGGVPATLYATMAAGALGNMCNDTVAVPGNSHDNQRILAERGMLAALQTPASTTGYVYRTCVGGNGGLCGVDGDCGAGGTCTGALACGCKAGTPGCRLDGTNCFNPMGTGGCVYTNDALGFAKASRDLLFALGKGPTLDWARLDVSGNSLNQANIANGYIFALDQTYRYLNTTDRELFARKTWAEMDWAYGRVMNAQPQTGDILQSNWRGVQIGSVGFAGPLLERLHAAEAPAFSQWGLEQSRQHISTYFDLSSHKDQQGNPVEMAGCAETFDYCRFTNERVFWTANAIRRKSGIDLSLYDNAVFAKNGLWQREFVLPDNSDGYPYGDEAPAFLGAQLIALEMNTYNDGKMRWFWDHLFPNPAILGGDYRGLTLVQSYWGYRVDVPAIDPTLTDPLHIISNDPPIAQGWIADHTSLYDPNECVWFGKGGQYSAFHGHGGDGGGFYMCRAKRAWDDAGKVGDYGTPSNLWHKQSTSHNVVTNDILLNDTCPATGTPNCQVNNSDYFLNFARITAGASTPRATALRIDTSRDYQANPGGTITASAYSKANTYYMIVKTGLHSYIWRVDDHQRDSLTRNYDLRFGGIASTVTWTAPTSTHYLETQPGLTLDIFNAFTPSALTLCPDATQCPAANIYTFTYPRIRTTGTTGQFGMLHYPAYAGVTTPTPIASDSPLTVPGWDLTEAGATGADSVRWNLTGGSITSGVVTSDSMVWFTRDSGGGTVADLALIDGSALDYAGVRMFQATNQGVPGHVNAASLSFTFNRVAGEVDLGAMNELRLRTSSNPTSVQVNGVARSGCDDYNVACPGCCRIANLFTDDPRPQILLLMNGVPPPTTTSTTSSTTSSTSVTNTTAATSSTTTSITTTTSSTATSTTFSSGPVGHLKGVKQKGIHRH